MTNYQLTELSAKAIGLRLLDVTTDNGSRMIHPDDGGGYWHPLQSNDDVVRLIAALKITIAHGAMCSVVLDEAGNLQSIINWQPHYTHKESMAALRLAVTTLAARVELSKGENHE